MADVSPIILTHCGKLGDFLYCLPIAEWFWREKGRKTHWVLTSFFAPFLYISRLLKIQEHCAEVTVVDHKLANLDAGGQPYRFNPGDFGVDGEYLNLGFRSYPSKYISQFYCDEHGLDYVRDYKMKIWLDGQGTIPSGEILRSSEIAMNRVRPDIEPIPTVMDLLDLAQRLACAKEFHSWFCGMAVLAWFCDIPQHVYRVPGHGRKDMYFPGATNITWHEIKL